MRKDNGGPAFPATSWTKDGDFLGENQGMTLRDYFAAKAMQGLIASLAGTPGRDWLEADQWAPGVAYQVADAMLAERSKE